MSAMRGTRAFLLAGLIALVSLWGAQRAFADECDSVANPNFAVGTPPADAGAAAALSGVWSGLWTIQVGTRKSERHPVSFCGKLHVSVTGPQSANVAYCVGNQPALGMVAGCSRTTAAIAGNQLTFTSAGNISYAFAPSGGGLMAQYSRPGTQGGVSTEFRKAQ